MLYEGCFLIQPKKDLDDLLKKYSAEYNDLGMSDLYEPSCWIRTLSDWVLLSDEQIRAKLLFMVSIYEDGVESDHIGYHKLINEIFSEPPLQESTFDKWWTIEFLRYSPVRYDKIDSVVDRSSLKYIATTGNKSVDEWRDYHLTDNESGN